MKTFTTNFIAWAGFNGELVYTTECRSFSFLENSKQAITELINRGDFLQKAKGESFEEIEVELNPLNDNGKIYKKSKLKGLHKVYTNVKINDLFTKSLTSCKIENMMKQAEQFDNEYLLINYKN